MTVGILRKFKHFVADSIGTRKAEPEAEQPLPAPEPAPIVEVSPETIQKNRIQASGLFDPQYYLRENPDLRLEGEELFDHYIHHGGPEGRKAHPLFDPPYYRSLYRDVADANLNPLYHYLEYGAKEGRIPHPLFDPSFYLEQLNKDEVLEMTPLEHFFAFGRQRQLDPNPYFSTRYYLSRYEKSLPKDVNPLSHYWTVGAREGFDPHPFFITNYYLEANPDVARTAVNPLHHYLSLGLKEGRDANPLFDASWYNETYCSAESALSDAANHYRMVGSGKGFDPSPALSNELYLEIHPEIAQQKVNPVEHLLLRHLNTSNDNQNKQMAPLRLWLRDLYRKKGNSTRSGELISVVVPCFNQGEWLEDALISVHLATNRPIEIIVVDDGSHERETLRLLPLLCESYQAKLITQKNAGLSGARNSALLRASGKFIQFLDSDDLLLPGKIDLQLDSGEADIFITDYYITNAWLGGWIAPFPSTIKGFTLSYESLLRNWERGLSIPIHCGLFSKKILTDFQFAIELSAKEDWLMWLALAEKNPRINFLDLPLVLYRQHYRNMGKRSARMGEAYLRTALKIASETQNHAFIDHAFTHFRELYVEQIKQEALQERITELP